MTSKAVGTRTVEIARNVFMPMMGIGTWALRNKSVLHGVLDTALGAGYRFIDTAHLYKNESIIGEHLKQLLPKHNLTRKDIFITSKLMISQQATQKARLTVAESLSSLQTDYIDLYLINFPGAKNVSPSDGDTLKKLRAESWQVLEEFLNEGKLHAIGVSNYQIHHLDQMKTYAKTMPAINQCEFHPHHISTKLISHCRQNGIHFQAHSPLGTSNASKALFQEPLIVSLSQKYKCTPAQLILAWAMHQNVSVLPKTANSDHVVSNLLAKDLQISEEDVKQISNLDRNQLYSWSSTRIA